MQVSNQLDLTGLTIKQIRAMFKQLQSDVLPLHWLDGWLMHVLDKPFMFLITDEDYQPTLDESSKIAAGIMQLSAGKPLAYLTGQQSFWGRHFLVNGHTLIPRADTEILVETILNYAKTQQKIRQADNNNLVDILDLGTGTGCIGITLALELKFAQVVLVDISSEALKIAEQNNHRLNARCQLLQSHWFQKVSGQFDIIVSNPPYIKENDEHLVNLKHEPITALVAAEDGLTDIRHIIETGRAYLKDGGLMAIEHGFDQAEAVRNLYLSSGYLDVYTIQDYGGNDRVTLGRYKNCG
ncbi:peptide chain release factor N(5)-glutamine methyltransferase [Moraxella catarrhalis]|uniref:peptide chain release factor N(5)-glutamine methyltransferase n=1 Tax=Moraxella catarrhalis TaxID=480 RepID=UPI000EAA678B|nr:peptide chain release factor N(5)-glutamine methyltransferase [Moraxella catarrhalis]RKM34611.1 peptide chain release factor N(5)-glutamine methyltransferase [Moraxella catarrhalis]